MVQSCWQGKELKVSVEDDGQRASPSLKKSPKEGRRLDGAVIATMEEEEEVMKDRPQHSRPQAQQPSTGPASRAARGSSTSIPFIDCSDVDSEYDLLREQMSRSHSQTNDNYEGDSTSGAYVDCRDEKRYRDSSATSVKSSHQTTQDCNDGSSTSMSFYAGGSPRILRHSTLIDEMFRGPDIRSPLATPLPSSSKGSSPHRSSSRAGSQSCISENGRNCKARSDSDDVCTYTCHGYIKCSPVLQRPHMQVIQNPSNRSETDPFILSQVTSTPGQECRPDRYFTGGMVKVVPLEGKNMANGVLSTGQPKQSPVMHALYARGMMDHISTVQMMEGSTSSGTESSDSDSEMVNPFTHPLVFGNPIVLNSSPLARNKYSFGSLQLDEEVEDVSVGLGDDDGVHVFGC